MSSNRISHCIGLPLYVIGFALVVGYFPDLHNNPITGITLVNSDLYVLDRSSQRRKPKGYDIKHTFQIFELEEGIFFTPA